MSPEDDHYRPNRSPAGPVTLPSTKAKGSTVQPIYAPATGYSARNARGDVVRADTDSEPTQAEASRANFR